MDDLDNLIQNHSAEIDASEYVDQDSHNMSNSFSKDGKYLLEHALLSSIPGIIQPVLTA